MTGAIAFNLILSIGAVAGLAAVCRLAYVTAGPWRGQRRATLERLPERTIDDRKAA
jgi:hypothetical protein